MELFVPLPPTLTSSLSHDVPGFVSSRLAYLWLSMFATVLESPLQSLDLSRSLYKVCRQYGIQLPEICTDLLCRSCHMLQIPSVTCRVRVNHRSIRSRTNINLKRSSETEGNAAVTGNRSISNILVNCKDTRGKNSNSNSKNSSSNSNSNSNCNNNYNDSSGGEDSKLLGVKNEIVRTCCFCNVANSKISGGSRGTSRKKSSKSSSSSNCSNNGSNNGSNSSSNSCTVAPVDSLSSSSSSGLSANVSNSSTLINMISKSSPNNKNNNNNSNSSSNKRGNSVAASTAAKKPFSFLDSLSSNSSSSSSSSSLVSSKLSSLSTALTGNIFGSNSNSRNNSGNYNAIINKRPPNLLDLENLQKQKKKKL